MNKILTLCLLFAAIVATGQNKTWIGGTGSWDVAANWMPAGVPLSTHNVFISGPTSKPQLASSQTVNNLSVTAGGGIDLNTDTLTVFGTATLQTNTGVMPKSSAINGRLVAGRFVITNVDFTDIELESIGGPPVASTINGATIFNGNALIFNNSTPSTPFSISNVGTSNVEFNGPVTFIRNAAIINIAPLGTVVFHDQVTLEVFAAANVFNLANQGTLVFNDTLFINSSVGGNINVGANGGVMTINAPGAIRTNSGYTGGVLNFSNITQNGTASNSLLMPATLRTDNCTFGGSFSSVSNSLDLNRSTFSRINNFESNIMVVDSCHFGATGLSTTFTKTTGNAANWPGNNTFHGDFMFIRNADNRVNLANAGGNTFLGDAVIVNNSINTNLYLLAGTGGSYTSYFHGDIEIIGSTEINLSTGKMEIAGKGGTRNFFAFSLLPHYVDTLIMNADSAVFDLQADIQIRGQLVLSDGIINSIGSQLRILDNATVLGGADSTHVNGAMIKIGDDAFTFPIGDNGFYAPLSISAPLSVLDTYFAQYYKQNPSAGGFPPANTGVDIDHVSVKEYWAIAGGFSPLVVTLSWDFRSGGVTNPIDLRVVRWDGLLWADAGNGFWTGTTASGTISTAGTLAMGLPVYLTLASNTPLPANPLPIELLSFTARPEGDKVQLNWTTATETNNDFFTVERSADGRIFEAIGQLPGAGTSITPNYYAMTDAAPIKGLSYYRLRQTDFDGTSQVSNVVSVFMENEVHGDIQVFPNPVENGTLQIYTAGRQSAGPIRLLNAFGQQVATAVELNQGYWQMDTSGLAPGVYFLHSTTDDFNKGYKVVVK